MSKEAIERVGELADKIDNLLHAMQLPLGADFHLAQIRTQFPVMRDELRAIYTELSGANPWE